MTTPNLPDPTLTTDVADGAQERPGFSRRQLLRGLSLAVAPIAASTLTACGGASAAEPDSTPVAADTPTTTTTTDPAPVTITTTPYKVAMIGRIGSARFNLDEAINTLIAFMGEAKANGASLVTAGELYLPGYDPDLNYTTDWATRMWPTYKLNSITVGDSNWLRILAAAQSIGIAVNFGFSERADQYYYMSQALIGDDGTVWYKRRKIRPSGSERRYWSDDVMNGNLSVTTTKLGRISMLMCWDHLRPQSTFNVMAQSPNVHICAWPYTRETASSTPGWDRQEVAHTAAAYFSQLSGAFTLLTTVGYCAVFRSSVMVAQLTPSDAASMLYYTITPGRWTGSTGSTTSEFSWGVLQALNDNYPGQRVADSDHGVLNLVPQT